MAYRRTYFRGGQVTTPQIIEGAVTEDKIADNAVTSPKIKNATIQTEDIADGAVTLDKLGSDVPAVGIADLSITTAKLATEAVTREKINDQAVDSLKIADRAVTNANNAIGSGEIQNGAVTPEKLSFTPVARPLTPPVTTDEIGDGQVTQAKLAPGVGGGDTLTMFPTPQTALDQGGIVATTQPAQVDLSAIIPLNTKAVIVSIACINQSWTDGGMMAYIFRQLGAEYALQVMAPPVNAPGISNGASVLMPVATDRTLLWQAYVGGNNSTELVIYILGYVV